MAKTDRPRIAILGAGPVGIEAGLYALRLQLPVTIYERADVGAHVQRWGHVRLFSPFSMNATPLGLSLLREADPDVELPGDNECITGHGHLEAYVKPLSRLPIFEGVIQQRTTVLQVGRRGFLKTGAPGDAKRARQPFVLHVRDAKGNQRLEEADVVLDCTGTYGQHRWAGVGGIAAIGERELAKEIDYELRDVSGEKRDHYAGKTILVLGAGYSAATTICRLADLAQEDSATWVIWLTRAGDSQPMRRIANDPLKERDRLAMRANTLATRAEGNVEHHNRAEIEMIEKTDEGYRVVGTLAGEPSEWEVERIIANVGFTPDTEIYRELQVHECYATLGPMSLSTALLKHGGADCLQIPNQGANVLRNPEPNFYVLGGKSFGRNTNFLLRTGFEQVRDVFTLITGNEKLNLHKP